MVDIVHRSVIKVLFVVDIGGGIGFRGDLAIDLTDVYAQDFYEQFKFDIGVKGIVFQGGNELDEGLSQHGNIVCTAGRR